MASKAIHGKRRTFSASAVLEAFATDLSAIKREEKLTYSDIGALLGKSEDQAAKYCEASAEIGLIAYSRAKREWNGRATGSVDRLCEESRPPHNDDRHDEGAVLRAALALSEALADGKGISTQEVLDCRAVLENARDAIDAQLSKLKPKAREIGA